MVFNEDDDCVLQKPLTSGGDARTSNNGNCVLHKYSDLNFL